MRTEELIQKGVARAQEIARANGLKIGDVVAHPSDKMTYELFSIDGDVANVSISAEASETGEEVKNQFPLNELFDPNVALNEAFKAKFGLD